MNSIQALSVALSTLSIGSAAMAADPAIFLERAYTLSSGPQVNSFRVPTTNASGKIRYYDVVINLSVDAAGKIGSTAQVGAVVSPPIPGDKFVNGFYTWPGGGTPCKQTVGILNNSRQEVAMSCLGGSGSTFMVSWTTGDLAGHPYELDLIAAGIDQIPGREVFGWGKVGSTTANAQWWSCLSTNDIVSARQVGDQVTITGYDAGNVAKCATVLTLVP